MSLFHRPALHLLAVLLLAAPAAAIAEGNTAAEAPAEEAAPAEQAATTEVDATPASDGPTLDLPPEEESSPTPSPEPEAEPSPDPAASPTADGVDPLRGMQEHRFATAASTSIGGYGELHYNRVQAEGEDGSEGEIDLHRLVIFIAHNVSNDLRIYSEIEVEHALAGNGKPGEVGIEQAFVDYRLLGDLLSLRAGIVLVPMGIINQWHEPPIFNGVERPLVDKVIIPSTWREAGIGLVGTPIEGLNYELYLVSGLNAGKFKAKDSLRGGRQKIAEAKANSFAVTGRVEYEPMLGIVVGGSAYYGEAGPNADLIDVNGNELELGVPILGFAGDIRGRWQGLEMRAVVASFSIGSTGRLRQAADEDGNVNGPDIGSKTLGYYAELGYDVLSLFDSEQQLVPFARYELSNPMHEVTGRDKTADDRAHEIRDLVFGISYRPAAQVVFKADVILRDPTGDDNNSTITNLGLGFMF